MSMVNLKDEEGFAPVDGMDNAVLADHEIRELANKGMITPFEPHPVRKDQHGNRLISYGLSSYGYDVRLGNHFSVFTNVHGSIVDPKRINPSAFVRKTVHGEPMLIPPNSFALAESVERFCIPRNVITICLGKSTYARCGILVNVTPLEPEWEGQITIEISNTTPAPALVYPSEGIMQLLFLRANGRPCEMSYADKGGKYQGQSGITLPTA